MFYFVEHSIAVIKPKQPFLDWINQNFKDLPEHLSLDTIRIDCNSYLIPEVDEIEDGISYIDQRFEDIFAIELASWIEDESVWPQDLTLKMFLEWFDVEVFPTMIDLTDLEDTGEVQLARGSHSIH